MEEPGQKLRQSRERLGLRFRDVEELSERLAERHRNNEYIIKLSRLSEIENRGVVPSIFKMYSLCCIYRLDLNEVMSWYGVSSGQLPADSVLLEHPRTHIAGLGPAGVVGGAAALPALPIHLDPGIDLRKTTFLSRMVQQWGPLPLSMLQAVDWSQHRIAFVGLDDWRMYPILPPGSLLLIEPAKAKIQTSGWASELERPIYLIEERSGWSAGWCALAGNQLILLSHPSSEVPPKVIPYPDGVEVLGQVVGVATRLEPRERPRTRS